MLKKCFKKIIMAFNTAKGEPVIKNNPQKPIIENPNPTPPALYQLNAGELVFLINLVSKSTFEGNQIETIYNTVVKLQNQFLEQNK
jgi:hypothetical protein